MNKRDSSTALARSTNSGTTSLPNVSSVSFTVLGQLWSMKNGKSPNRRGGTFKNPKARKFEQDFALQVPPGAKVGMGSRDQLLRATVTVWYPSWRQDADFELVYDLLQHTGVVSNDRWIRQKHQYAEVDPKNPRVEIILEEL